MFYETGSRWSLSKARPDQVCLTAPWREEENQTVLNIKPLYTTSEKTPCLPVALSLPQNT